MDEFRSNDFFPYRGTVREIFEAWARDMTLTIKVRARKNYGVFFLLCATTCIAKLC